jgi:hypothetical protein
MKRLLTIAILGAVVLGFMSCGQKEVKPEEDKEVVTVDEKTKVVVEDKFDDTEYQNVVKVLREAIDAERTNPIPRNKLNTAKAYALVAKFFRENLNEPRYGFKREDITEYKEMATFKCNDVIRDPSSTRAIREEAEAFKSHIERI